MHLALTANDNHLESLVRRRGVDGILGVKVIGLAPTALIVAAVLGVGCRESQPGSHAIEPPPLQEAVVIHGLPLDGTVDRASAAPLPVRSIALPRDPSTFDHSRLLGDGTLYRLELEDGATLVRFADVTNPELGSTRLPLVAPPGQTIRSEYGHFRIATSSPGLSIDRDGRGSVWWEEDGPEGRHIEFRIDGNRAEMVSPVRGCLVCGSPAARSTSPVGRFLTLRGAKNACMPK